MKIAMIVAYFGTLPSYFQVFLDSCRMNRNFDWLIFTNDTTEYNYPSNVHQIVMSFNECRQAVQKRFSFPVALKTPQKLCDYKCAYGYIFEDYLKDYDWWGHCDLDQIFGDLSVSVTEDRLNTLDKIYSLGHLTLYRNTDVNEFDIKDHRNCHNAVYYSLACSLAGISYYLNYYLKLRNF